MSSDYLTRQHTRHRKMFALLVDEMRPPVILSEEYEAALRRTNRRDVADERGRSVHAIWTIATCLACFGEGCEGNPKWIDGETPHETEVIDCQTCRGTGLVEIIDLPEPPALDDDMPF